jgi:hypothetical protein
MPNPVVSPENGSSFKTALASAKIPPKQDEDP